MVYEEPITLGNVAVNVALYLVPAGAIILRLRRRIRRQ
jgi:hypothetical protein